MPRAPKIRIRNARTHRVRGVLCIGDAIDDVYLFGRHTRVNPEDPNMMIFTVNREAHGPGGALFAAANYRCLSHELTYGQFLVTMQQIGSMRNLHVLRDLCTFICKPVDVITKIRVFDHDAQRIIARFDKRKAFSKHVLKRFKRKFHLQKKNYSAVIVSDYQKGCVDDDTREYLRKKFLNVPMFIDTKNPDLSVWNDFPNAIVKINAVEYERSINAQSVKHLIVTAGEQGAFYFNRGEMKHFPTFSVSGFVPNTIGAGDIFLAGLADRMLKTQDIEESIRYANVCARASLKRFGGLCITRRHVEHEIRSLEKLCA